MNMSVLKSIRVFFALALGYMVLAIFVTNSYYQLILTLVLIWAIFGLSWNIFSGYTGLVSFGHASFFGIGAFATVLAQIYWGLSPWLMFFVSGLIGAVAGVLIGFPTFKLRGHYFALSMLAYPLALMYVFQWLGFPEVSIPRVHDNPAAYMQFTDGRVYTLIAMVFLCAVVVLSRAIEASRFGMALIAIKQNEAAAEAAGIDTLRWKLKAIALSGAIAAMAGSLYAVVILVITPQSVFGMLVSAQALTVTMFGGAGTLWGPIIGASFLIPIAEVLHAELGNFLPGIQGVVYGVAIVVLITAAPEGMFWKIRDRLRSRKEETSPVIADQPVAANVTPLPARETRGLNPEIVLDVRNMSKNFGGLKAVQNVSFQVNKGMILGIIGPNGAGKTTLFNLLNGFQLPSEGEVMVDGVNMARRKPHELCQAGVGRTFQIMRPFTRMSVRDNVKVGSYVTAKSEEEAETIADDALRQVGLLYIAHQLAGGLSTKDLRLMELARALAGKPHILLLDETLAGLGKEEAVEVVAVIRRLSASGVTVVIIEHTMHAMVQLVDRFLVLDHGQVITEGLPQEVTRDSRVIEAYLGKKWVANA
ncbi:branched-chain amino acid ABC transporter ATP-binding protein/permease [Agrobacterium sp. Azo12]|uniref:branched-chain amino acid ABC transporter ATP-binding protein/permease n=1 Tax=Agrobacterium sp. Azo12 TaxID=3031129 RepID=UPI0023D86738|nr:branched-chain amino acid ABC transporter ATP-binding protein/permease [Agrobacterium sp. Azo12]MDO5897530.1 branched-chain amino acid ABC transporter ATP-binding protein/permease [Agrobacterium sp. Azo12]